MPLSMLRHQPKGQCRWCDEPILKPNGEVNTARGWHPECVTTYRIAAFSNDQRAAVWKRDHGVCARCGTDTVKEIKSPWSNRAFVPADTPYHLVGPMGHLWQADHVRPLLDAKGDMAFYLLSNLQTLCTKCHVAKGVEDNRRRKAANSTTDQLTFA